MPEQTRRERALAFAFANLPRTSFTIDGNGNRLTIPDPVDQLLRVAEWLLVDDLDETVDVLPDEDCSQCQHPGIRHSQSGCMVITGQRTALGEEFCGCLRRGDSEAWRSDVMASPEALLTTGPGQVAWRIEVSPHSWAVDGQAYEHGVGAPSEAAEALLQVAREIGGWRETIADADVLAARRDADQYAPDAQPVKHDLTEEQLEEARAIRAWADKQAPRATPDGQVNAQHVAIEQTRRGLEGLPSFIHELDGPGNFLPPTPDFDGGDQDTVDRG